LGFLAIFFSITAVFVLFYTNSAVFLTARQFPVQSRYWIVLRM